MLENLQSLPADPLLGLIGRYTADKNPNKIDLGVGVYRDETGSTPVLACVKQAERFLLANETSKAYVGPAGNAVFIELLSRLVLADLYLSGSDRLAAVQTPGGCGALRILADISVRANPQARLFIGDPTWANHIPLLAGAGLSVEKYAYYDHASQQVNFDSMQAALNRAEPGDIILLHGCCHNPSGADLSEAQWVKVVEICRQRSLVPLIDIAYQGFGDGVEKDVFGARLAVAELPEVLIAVSCSKNFGLYRERVGAAIIAAQTPAKANAALSHLNSITRGLYSMPPSHGASVVATVLGSDELRDLWCEEVEQMRERIYVMRSSLVAQLGEIDGRSFSFIERQKGMFSFLGIDSAQVKRLAENHAIYMADSSRANIAGLNQTNMRYFCDSLASSATGISGY